MRYLAFSYASRAWSNRANTFSSGVWSFSDTTRSEYEYPIPLAEAQQMLATLCPFKVEKNRYIIEHQGHRFEIDEFLGDNAPLILAELELPSETTAYSRPNWLGKEITSDGRYTNAYLSTHPYPTWQNTP